jgi:hypothetical protein
MEEFETKASMSNNLNTTVCNHGTFGKYCEVLMIMKRNSSRAFPNTEGISLHLNDCISCWYAYEKNPNCVRYIHTKILYARTYFGNGFKVFVIDLNARSEVNGLYFGNEEKS